MLLDDCLFRLRLLPAVLDGCPTSSSSSSVSGEEEELLDEKLIPTGMLAVAVAGVVVADPGMAAAGKVVVRSGGYIEDIARVEEGGILREEEVGIGIPMETGATSKVTPVLAVVVTGVDTLVAVAEVEWRASSWLKNL